VVPSAIVKTSINICTVRESLFPDISIFKEFSRKTANYLIVLSK
jgi:hypothetical protein